MSEDLSKKPPPYPTMADPVTKRYVVSGVSSLQPKVLQFDGVEISNLNDNDPHRIFRISAAVLNTNRAAMAEYAVVMRPKKSGTTAYRYVTRTFAVLNQVDEVDVNLPVVFFDINDSKLKIKLYQFATGQDVGVEITRWWASGPNIPGPTGETNDLGSSGRSA